MEQNEITAIVTRLAAAQAADNLLRKRFLDDMLYMGYVPPTKWQRRKASLKDFLGRFKLAYRALRGDDLCDCDY